MWSQLRMMSGGSDVGIGGFGDGYVPSSPVANGPGTYRSLLASELPLLQPDLRILEIDPAEVETALTILHPAVILCSRAPAHIRAAEVTVLVLHGGKVDLSLLAVDGTIVNPQLSDILVAIDRALSAGHPATSDPQSNDSLCWPR